MVFLFDHVAYQSMKYCMHTPWELDLLALNTVLLLRKMDQSIHKGMADCTSSVYKKNPETYQITS